MVLEDYFEIEKFDSKLGPAEEIRLKGHNITIDIVINAYKEGNSPEKIAGEIYPTLSLDKVYATILYYLRNKDAVDEYLARGREICEANYREWLQKEPAPVVKRLRELKAQMDVPEAAHG